MRVEAKLQRQIRLLCDDAVEGLCRIPTEKCPYPDEKCGLCYAKAIIALLEKEGKP